MAEPARIWDPYPARRAALIVNMGSRRGGGTFQRALERLCALGVDVCHPCSLSNADTLADAVNDALGQGTELIVVGGGDGTFSAAANLLAGKGVALGVLPLGTGNDFARTLGIPLDLEGACRVIAEGRLAYVDLGRINGRYFVNTVGIGFTAHAADRLLPRAKRWLGRGAYALAAAWAFRGYRGFRVRACIDGRSEEFDALEVIVGNGRFHAAGTLLAPGASIESGRLVFYAFEGLSRWQLLKMAMIVYRGRHIYHRQAHFTYCREVTIETDPREPILADGEPRGETPARISVVHRALPVIVPGEPRGGELVRW